MSKKGQKKNKLRDVHTRLFDEDCALLERVADEKGTKWQVELRLLVRRALKNEKREILIIK